MTDSQVATAQRLSKREEYRESKQKSVGAAESGGNNRKRWAYKQRSRAGRPIAMQENTRYTAGHRACMRDASCGLELL